MKGEELYYFISILSVAGIVYPHPVLLGFVMWCYLAIAALMIITSIFSVLTINYGLRTQPELMMQRFISTATTHSHKARKLWLIKLLISVALTYLCGFVYAPFIVVLGHIFLWTAGEIFLKKFTDRLNKILSEDEQEDIKSNNKRFNA